MLTLYSYFRSSAAWRVRIALHWKQLPYQTAAVHLLRDGGEQHRADYQQLNPQCLVPALRLADGAVLTQSLATIEYLDEHWPQPPLLPADALGRAQVRALAQLIACDIHPLNNLRVLQYLKGPLGHDDNVACDWYRHWVQTGFAALEQWLARLHGDATEPTCWPGAVTLADACLVPQVYNARRFCVDMSAYPRIQAIETHCLALPAFAASHPERQPDAE